MLELISAKTPSEGTLRPDDLASHDEAILLHGILKLTLPTGGVQTYNDTEAFEARGYEH